MTARSDDLEYDLQQVEARLDEALAVITSLREDMRLYRQFFVRLRDVETLEDAQALARQFVEEVT